MTIDQIKHELREAGLPALARYVEGVIKLGGNKQQLASWLRLAADLVDKLEKV